jgi:hypothetical protein
MEALKYFSSPLFRTASSRETFLTIFFHKPHVHSLFDSILLFCLIRARLHLRLTLYCELYRRGSGSGRLSHDSQRRETLKYGHEYYATRDQEWVCCRGPAAIYLTRSNTEYGNCDIFGNAGETWKFHAMYCRDTKLCTIRIVSLSQETHL